MSTEHFDVLLVGAGVSGIGAAYYLQSRCPAKRYAILEGRADLGGTWDLFRYPGIRSDSDMFTLGYSFRPWKGAKAIADGPSILAYVRETAQELGIIKHIYFQQRVISASWSSKDARWTVITQGPTGETITRTCSFLYLCSGYYRYDEGFTPSFPGRDDFEGVVIHPQFWPQDLDYKGKRVVVIGSGATAVTLVPAMAKEAAHVTMLQRSPTYVASLPSEDRLANRVREILPEGPAHQILRWKNALRAIGFYQLSRRAPEVMKKLLRKGLELALPPGYDIDKHFKPHYEPWDERLCIVPDADLFRAIRKGQASVVTDQIRTFTKNGILLESGEELKADIIVTATGLSLVCCGGISISVDNRPITLNETFVYKGLMLSGVPNFAFCVGYTNASWTLRAELSSLYVCRVLNLMDKRGARKCTPELREGTIESQPLLDLSSGYVQRAVPFFPKQGKRAPWYLRQNYVLDALTMRLDDVDDGVLRFG